MASNQEIIRDRFDLSKGGLLFEPDRVAITKDTDFVFVSLGGMGLATLVHIKTKVARECAWGNQNNSVRFLAIDTDTNLIEQFRVPDQGFEPLEDDEFVLLQEQIAPNVLTLPERHKLSQLTRDWLSPDLNHVVDSNGASGVRQVGRFLFTWPQNHAKVVSALSEIARELDPGRALEVYFVAGIAGGTGSGGFVDLAYLIRKLFSINGNTPNKHLKAFLYLPDTRDLLGKPVDEQHQYRNGLCALKELSYFMNLDHARKGDPANANANASVNLSSEYSFTYPDGSTVSSTDRIFDQCYLVSGAETAGKRVRKEEATTIMVASSIVNQIVFAENANQQSLVSQLSNVVATTPNAAIGDNVDKYIFNTNFIYYACGYSETRLPTQECYAYAVKSIFEAVNELFEGERSLFHENHGRFAAEMMSQCGLADLTGLEQKLTEKAGFSTSRVGDVNRPQYDDLAGEQADDADLFNYEWTRFGTALESVMGQMNYGNAVQAYVNDLSTHLDTLFNQNPFRAFFVLNVVDGRGVTYPECVKGRFNALLAELQVNLDGYTAALKRAQEQYPEALGEYNHAGFLTKGGARRALFDKAQALAQAKFNKALCETKIMALKAIVSGLMDSYDKYFRVYAKVLEVFSRLMNDIGSYVTDARTQTTGASSLFSYDAAPLYAVTNNRAAQERHNSLISHIDEVVAQMDKEQFVRDFMAKLQAKREDWFALLAADDAAKDNPRAKNVENADVKIDGLVASIQDFFKDNYEQVAQLTLEDYLVIAYQGNNNSRAQALRAAAADIYAGISSRSVPLYRLERNYNFGELEQLSYKAVCVPGLARSLYNEIEDVSGAAAQGSHLHMYQTSSSNAVYMYQVYYTLPAYILEQLVKMETEYDRALERGECGNHLEENPCTDRVWSEFPTPLPLAMRPYIADGANVPDGVETEMRDRVHRCVERLTTLHILIEGKPAGNNRVRTYSVRIPGDLVRPGFEVKFDKKGNRTEGADRFQRFDRDDFISKQYQQLTTMGRNTPYDESYDTLLGYFGNDTVPVNLKQTFGTYALHNIDEFETDLRCNLDRLKMLESLLRLYDYAMEPVKEVNRTIAASSAASEKAKLFARALICRAICFDQNKSLWAFGNKLRMGVTPLLNFRRIRAFVLNRQAKTYLTAYYLYEGYRALFADEVFVARINQFLTKEDDDLFEKIDAKPDEYDAELAAREAEKDRLIAEVQALFDNEDSSTGGLAFGGEETKGIFIRIFEQNDPERSDPSYFDELYEFYQNLLTELTML